MFKARQITFELAVVVSTFCIVIFLKGNFLQISWNSAHDISPRLPPHPAHHKSYIDTSVELRRFQYLMEDWPKDKPKAALYVLLQADELRISKFKILLGQLESHFSNHYNYPLILFHEDDLNQTLCMDLKKMANYSDIYFQRVDLSVPEFLKEPVPQRTICSKHTVGYRSMCRFHAKVVYQQPILSDLDYAWRLDDDSEIRSPVASDPFKHMESEQLLYGYHDIAKEADTCMLHLRNNITSCLKAYDLTEKPNWFDNNIYYNNFEISKLSVWRSDQYQNYINFLDQAGGIYYYRWGDAPIKTYYVRLFLESKKVYQFSQIHYSHQGSKSKSTAPRSPTWTCSILVILILVQIL